MRFIVAAFFVSVFLFASCAKEQLEGFDDQITEAYDFRVDVATGDTFYKIYMPNAFSPNKDGRNDLYLVYGQGFDYNNFNMQIFSREGNLIYSASSPYNAWDGTAMGIGGVYCPMALYTVKINVADTTHEMHHYVYDAMLFR